MDSRELLLARTGTGKAEPARADQELRELRRRIEGSAVADAEGGVERFSQRATEAGTVVLRCATPEDVAAALTAQLRSLRRVVLAGDALTRRCRFNQYFRERLPDLRVYEDGAREEEAGEVDAKRRAADMDAGIDSGIAGIADSGAVVICASESERRSVSLLSAMHVVLLPVDRILPSLVHAAPLLRAETGAEGRSAVTIVGGPSKTADIEKVLVTGVHGPGRFVIVLIDSA
jgi:L-lactate utilization protein LutC